MKIKSIGSNKTELHLKDLVILISYETPVAAIRVNSYTVPHGLRTDQYFSNTTSKHINTWFKDRGIDDKYIAHMEQNYFDQLLDDNT